ncbi:hypothetical protein D6C82_08950 [Aureobasidium pullulans]|nr:hypothetical protein D6C82_08950 [Aureobasidium pullulans]
MAVHAWPTYDGKIISTFVFCRDSINALLVILPEMKSRNLSAFAQKHNPELLQALDNGTVVTLHSQQKTKAEHLKKLERRLDKSIQDLGGDEGVKRAVKMLEFVSRVEAPHDFEYYPCIRVLLSGMQEFFEICTPKCFDWMEGLLPRLVKSKTVESAKATNDIPTVAEPTRVDVDTEAISQQLELEIRKEYETEKENWKAKISQECEEWKAQIQQELSDACYFRVLEAEKDAKDANVDAETAKKNLAKADQDAEVRVKKMLEKVYYKEMEKLKGEVNTEKARVRERDKQLEEARSAREAAEGLARTACEQHITEQGLRRRAEIERSDAVDQEIYTNDAEILHIRTILKEMEMYQANKIDIAVEYLNLEETLIATEDELGKTRTQLILANQGHSALIDTFKQLREELSGADMASRQSSASGKKRKICV